MHNVTWAKHIIQQLIEHGVQHFCIAPGSRSTPLAIALAEEKTISYTTHFDERGLGFYALGLAKGSGIPVGVIVTSGTAVGNLMPAVMEAWHDHVPLVLLTADRPPELRNCGANQTTDQVKIFSSFVHEEVDLPCAFLGGERYLASTISYAMHKATIQGIGPIHINCMFREPLASAGESLQVTYATHYHAELTELSVAKRKKLAAILGQHKKGVIICGQKTHTDASTAILELAEHLQWPLLADPASNLRGLDSPSSIAYYDSILKQATNLKPTVILHCGGRLVSRTLMEWCEKAKVEFYAHVDNRTSRLDAQHVVTDHFQVEPNGLCAALLHDLPRNTSSSWLSEWQEKSYLVKETLQKYLPVSTSCTEPGLTHTLQNHLTHEQVLFLANSMPIRNANLFLFPKKTIGPIFTNRGLSGIDGNIATVAGLAQGSGKPTIAIIGDLAALHDMNSLALIKKVRTPILLIVINNAGGGIFSFLPHLVATPHFEELFAHNHDWEFADAATMFQLPYFAPESMKSLDNFLGCFSRQPTTCLLELRTERADNYKLHQTLDAAISAAILASAELATLVDTTTEPLVC